MRRCGYATLEADLAIKAGDTLRGKYRLDALIGRGGMGQVFSASDLQSGREVAIKVVSRLFFDDVLMARLHREAEAAARIRSQHVPQVIEVSDTDEKEVFLVMERLHGEPLSQRLKDRGALPWEEVAQIGEDVLHGLIDAHAAGIVHRDLKPSNVFLAMKDRMRAMVLDFGVCKMDTLDTERLTATGESIGTVAYMAPEQIRGAAKVDERADLYAFGVLVFEMLTGRLPHEGPTQMAILASKLENQAVRLRDFTAVPIPTGVDDLVTRALRREPQDRFRSSTELMQVWRGLYGKSSGTLTPNVPFPPSNGDLHDAPTRVVGSMPPPAPYSRIPPPLSSSPPRIVGTDPHPTQTALTAGVSLGKSSSTKVVFALAACALVAGIAAVGAFFMRGAPPKLEATPASEMPTAVMAATDPAPPTPPNAATPVAVEDSIELPDVDAGVTALQSRSRAPVSTPRRGASRPTAAPATPKPSGQHITSQPRY